MGRRNKRRQKSRKISIPIQGALLKKYYPNSSLSSYMGLKLVWEAELTPTPFSQSYKVRIEYTLGYAPKTFVVHPKKLSLYTGETSLPHVYDNKKQRLCLYYPDGKDWHQGMSLADTIVPWTAEWLYFYENWLNTGVWHGGGEHPPRKKKKNIKNK
ncbi:hypothetical protein [Flavobacterium sp. C4GT6]|uniref:hypothetical protein n=1 Tax=Flavobacterium sp. C4GT6 TaxID=3103818 RepID=UPI002ECFD55F